MANRLDVVRLRLAGAIATALCLASTAPATPVRAAHSAALDAAAAGFKPYVLERIARSLDAVKKMRDRIAAHDLAGAQQFWLAARGGWEGSEVITNEYFPDLDRKIDAWPDAEKGFHAIEAKLFGAHDVQALPAAEELVANLTEFERQLRTTTLTPQGLLNGTAKLIYEIGENKAEGGESPFSGNSLAEIRDNLDSIAAAYERVFAPATRKSNAELAKSFSSDLAAMRSLAAVPTLQALDQVRLRDASESLVNDLAMVGQESGLDKPGLGN
ncbi:MAG TPA: EfeM/EfeO family lipoprotein [Steroidobacteraceae bacterium]|nr:EfeM/EfeO family lipoprotein [Steroidobacteraceae bacterium]